ncbi:hypothetical protein AA313_de0203218 [Arthrobotrys entomopaga]|nr:hypothetical protein AA313_de0203218 [Arthrobotrys entomopaga]
MHRTILSRRKRILIRNPKHNLDAFRSINEPTFGLGLLQRAPVMRISITSSCFTNAGNKPPIRCPNMGISLRYATQKMQQASRQFAIYRRHQCMKTKCPREEANLRTVHHTKNI